MDGGSSGGRSVVDCVCEVLANAGGMHDAREYARQPWCPKNDAINPSTPAKSKTKLLRDVVRQGRLLGLGVEEGTEVENADFGVLPYFPKEFLKGENKWLKSVVLPVLPEKFLGNTVNVKKKFVRCVYLVALATLGGWCPGPGDKSRSAAAFYLAKHRCCRCINPMDEAMGHHVVSNVVLNTLRAGTLTYAPGTDCSSSASAMRGVLTGLSEIVDGTMFALLGLAFSDFHELRLLEWGTAQGGSIRVLPPSTTTIAPVFPILKGAISRSRGKAGRNNIFRFLRLHIKHCDLSSAGFLCYRHVLERTHGVAAEFPSATVPSWLVAAFAPGSRPFLSSFKGAPPVMVTEWMEAFLQVSVVSLLRLAALLELQDLFHMANICSALGPDHPACSKKFGGWADRGAAPFVGAVLRPYAGPHYERRGWDLGSFDQLWPSALADYLQVLSPDDQYELDGGLCLPFWGVVIHRAWPKVRSLFDSVGILGYYDDGILKEVVARGDALELGKREDELSGMRQPQCLTHDIIGFRRFYEFVRSGVNGTVSEIRERNSCVLSSTEKSFAVGEGSLLKTLGTILLEVSAPVFAEKYKCTPAESKFRAAGTIMRKFFDQGHQLGLWNEYVIEEGAKLQKSAALSNLCYASHPGTNSVVPQFSLDGIPADIELYACLFTDDSEYYEKCMENAAPDVLCEEAEGPNPKSGAASKVARLVQSAGQSSDLVQATAGVALAQIECDEKVEDSFKEAAACEGPVYPVRARHETVDLAASRDGGKSSETGARDAMADHEESLKVCEHAVPVAGGEADRDANTMQGRFVTEKGVECEAVADSSEVFTLRIRCGVSEKSGGGREGIMTESQQQGLLPSAHVEAEMSCDGKIPELATEDGVAESTILGSAVCDPATQESGREESNNSVRVVGQADFQSEGFGSNPTAVEHAFVDADVLPGSNATMAVEGDSSLVVLAEAAASESIRGAWCKSVDSALHDVTAAAAVPGLPSQEVIERDCSTKSPLTKKARRASDRIAGLQISKAIVSTSLLARVEEPAPSCVKLPKLMSSIWCMDASWRTVQFSESTKFKARNLGASTPYNGSTPEGRLCSPEVDISALIREWPGSHLSARKVFAVALLTFDPGRAFLEKYEKSGRAIPDARSPLPTDFSSAQEYSQYHASLAVLEVIGEVRRESTEIVEERLHRRFVGEDLDNMDSVFTRARCEGISVAESKHKPPDYVVKWYPGLGRGLHFSVYNFTVSVDKKACNHGPKRSRTGDDRFERSCCCANQAKVGDFVQVRLQSTSGHGEVRFDGSLWENQRDNCLFKLIGFVTDTSEFFDRINLEISLLMPDALWNSFQDYNYGKNSGSRSSTWCFSESCAVHVTIVGSCEHMFGDVQALANCSVEELKLDASDESSKLSALAQTLGSRERQRIALLDEFNDLSSREMFLVRGVCEEGRLDQKQTEIVAELVHAYRASTNQAMTPVLEGGAGTGKSKVMAAFFKCLVRLHSILESSPMRIATAVASNRGCEAMMQKLTAYGLRVVFVSSSVHLNEELALSVAKFRPKNLALDCGAVLPGPWASATIEAGTNKTADERQLLQLRREWQKADVSYRTAVTRLDNFEKGGPDEDHLEAHAKEKHEESLKAYKRTRDVWFTKRRESLKFLTNYVVFTAQVYVGTPVGLRKCPELQGGRAYRVRVLACDEVGQMARMDIFRLSALSAVKECNFTLIAGDMKQLVHRLRVAQAELYQYAEFGLQNVLMSSHSRNVVMEGGSLGERRIVPMCAFKLNVNYRSAPEIVELASSAAYEGEMKASSFASRNCSAEYSVFGNVAYVDCAAEPSCSKTDYEGGGAGEGSNSSMGTKPKTNEGQVLRAIEYVEMLAITFSNEFYGLRASRLRESPSKSISVRILCSHVGGALHASELIKTSDLLREADVVAVTVDSFQGGEADVLLYVTIESGGVRRWQDTEFSGCPRRGLVGLTRGKFVTVIFGDSDFHRQCRAPFWGNVYWHCREKGFVWSAKEFDRALELGAVPASWAGNLWGPR